MLALNLLAALIVIILIYHGQQAVIQTHLLLPLLFLGMRARHETIFQIHAANLIKSG